MRNCWSPANPLLSLLNSCELVGYQIRQVNLLKLLEGSCLVSFSSLLTQEKEAGRLSCEVHILGGHHAQIYFSSLSAAKWRIYFKYWFWSSTEVILHALCILLLKELKYCKAFIDRICRGRQFARLEPVKLDTIATEITRYAKNSLCKQCLVLAFLVPA